MGKRGTMPYSIVALRYPKPKDIYAPDAIGKD
jgi:hypothetical protein